MNTLRAVSLGGLLVIYAFMPIAANAAQFLMEEQPNFPAGQTVNDDLYMAGGNVTSAGSVRGDLIAGGGSVLVSGPVSADLIVGGGNITVTGAVGDDIRAGGGNILIQGDVTGDVIIGGGQITLAGSRIGGDVAVGGGMLTISAPVAGDLKFGGGEIRIDAPISGSVEIDADKVTLGPRAVITGDLTYTASAEATLEEGARVGGETAFTQRETRGDAKAGIAAFITLWLFAKILMALAGAFAIAYIFKRFSRELVATAATQPLIEIGRGLVIFVVLPIVSVIFLFTVIGIPFGVLGLLSFFALLIFAHLAATIVTGSIVHKWIWKPAGYEVNWKTVLLGVLVYFVLGLIPFIGGIIKFGIMLITLGAMMNIKWSVMREWR